MYVSIRDHVLLTGGYPTIAEGLGDLGLRAVELQAERDCRALSLDSPGRATVDLSGDAGVEALREQAAANGVTISAFMLGTDFNSADIGRELDWVTRMVRVAAALGVPALRIDAIMHGERELPLAERQAIFARGVREVLSRTDGLPVDLGIENHGIQGNDPAFLEGLLAQVGSPRLGMTLDTGNFYWAGHPREEVYGIIGRLAPHAKHTHVKNIGYPVDKRDVRREAGWEYGRYACPIPEGDIDHKRVVSLLRAAGYDRDLCIEDESLGRFDEPTRRAHLKAAADHLRACAAG
jgi:sugar phosphate isomerase/epimerase